MTKEKKVQAKKLKVNPKAKAKAKAKGLERRVVTRSTTAIEPLAVKEKEVGKKPHQGGVLNKTHIPKKVRTDVWNTFIGPNIPIHKCLCCLKTTICMTDFQVGHVLSEHDGGNLNIDNMRPICASCNISMGTMNMKDYVVKYGYLI